MRRGLRRPSRRELLALGAAAGAIGLRIAAAEEPKTAGAPTAPTAGTARPAPVATPAGAPLSAYLFVGPGDRIHLILPVTEMGQGVSTSFAAQVAAEFGFPKATDVRVDQAPIGVAYASPGSQLQSTAGSTSVRIWHVLVGDAATRLRAMLMASAARQLGVVQSDVTLGPQHASATRRGLRRSRRVPLGKLAWQDGPVPMSRSFGRLAAGQGRVAPATNVHAGEIADGTLKYGIDQQRPNQLHAAVRCNPAAGAGVLRFDESAIRRREGVVDVVPVPGGIATLASSWWTAHRSLQDAAIEWQPGTGNSESLEAELRRQLETGPVLAAVPQLATAAALSAARAVVSRDYFVPMLAHAALEPLACTAEFVAGRCQLWMGTQSPQLVARDVARALDLPYESIDLHNFPMGGSFGRRVIGNEVAIQAALLARHSGRPVKVLWDREEDLRHDRFRPAIVARLSASLDAAHKPVTLTARVCGADWLDEVGNSRPQVKALTNTQGLATSPYAFRGVDTGFIEAKSPVPVGPWRSIAHGFNVFFLETFIDELAALAAADPIDFRHSLLAADSPGHAMLRAVRARCGWDSRRSALRTSGLRSTAAWR